MLGNVFHYKKTAHNLEFSCGESNLLQNEKAIFSINCASDRLC